MPDTAKQAEVKRRYPVVSGLELADKHEGRTVNLKPQGGSFVARRLKKCID